MEKYKKYEIVYDKFHKRWAFKPQDLPGALQVAKTRSEVIEKACPICSFQPSILRICNEEGIAEEERYFNM
jgi:hypothetical protein